MASPSKKRSVEETDIEIEADIPPKKAKVMNPNEAQSEAHETDVDIIEDEYDPIHSRNVRDIISSVVWKHNWKKKIRSSKITDRWKKEVVEQGGNACDFMIAIRLLDTMAMGKPIKSGYVPYTSSASYNWLRNDDIPAEERKQLDENRYATHWDDTKYAGNMELLFKHAIIKKNNYIHDSLANEFKSNIAKLMQDLIDTNNIDYHPGSDDKVWDIIHPSLYCYVKDVTDTFDTDDIDDKYILADYDKKKAVDFESLQASNTWRGFSMDINKYNRFQWLPTDFKIRRKARSDKMEVDDNESMYEGIKMLNVDQSDDIQVEIINYINNLDAIQHQNLYSSLSKILSRFVPLFDSILGERLPENIQVITKLANINLKEKQSFSGGVWHLEGMSYEHIIATGIFYWKMENIKESYLEFRRAIVQPTSYTQGDDEGVFQTYNTVDGQQLNEYLGKIKIEDGDCAVFPNFFQHKVKAFELNNEDFKGERDILVFFLIDPNIKILSTRNVLPQQYQCFNGLLSDILKETVPQIIIDDICSYLVRMTLDEAKEYRLKLMTERKYYYDEQNNCVFEREFSLCEH